MRGFRCRHSRRTRERTPPAGESGRQGSSEHVGQAAFSHVSRVTYGPPHPLAHSGRPGSAGSSRSNSDNWRSPSDLRWAIFRHAGRQCRWSGRPGMKSCPQPGHRMAPESVRPLSGGRSSDIPGRDAGSGIGLSMRPPHRARSVCRLLVGTWRSQTRPGVHESGRRSIGRYGCRRPWSYL
jgi:hypothetical protein